jgi:hypothetical protein
MSNTAKVKYVGDEEEYSGYDAGESIRIAKGATVTVSAAKAAQLAEDFPHDFEIDGKKPAPKKKTASLMKLTRADLDARAAELGIENPGDLENKEAGAEAILAAKAEEPEA